MCVCVCTPNSRPQVPKIVKLRRFYVIVIQKNANVVSFRKTILRKTLKIEFNSSLRPGQNCKTDIKNFFWVLQILLDNKDS
jgi:hypothetical protein